MPPILTVGHGTLSADAFGALVRDAGVEIVVDVRRYPGSRRHPQFGSDAMATWLPGHGIAYRWLAGLGGRRRAAPDSPNVALRNEQFRAYADHMASAEFTDALDALIEAAAPTAVTAVMCSESVWWRCHRRLLADHLVLIEARPVEHLFHDGRRRPHPPAPEARVDDGTLVYDLGSQPPLLDDGAG